MARHSINDFADILSSLEGRSKNKFLKAHAEQWEVASNDKELKGLLAGEGGEEVADYVLSFTADGKSALLDWLNEAVDQGLIDSPYEEAEEEEEEEEKPARKSRTAREEKVTAKKPAKRASRRDEDEDEEPRKRGRQPLTEDQIDEIREVLERTQSITLTVEETGRSAATIMKYIPDDERAAMGVRTHGYRRDAEEEDERPARKVVKNKTREAATGRGRPAKEVARGRTKEVVKNTRGNSRTSRGH